MYFTGAAWRGRRGQYLRGCGSDYRRRPGRASGLITVCRGAPIAPGSPLALDQFFVRRLSIGQRNIHGLARRSDFRDHISILGRWHTIARWTVLAALAAGTLSPVFVVGGFSPAPAATTFPGVVAFAAGFAGFAWLPAFPFGAGFTRRITVSPGAIAVTSRTA
jgi:hypothetical protein